MRLRLGIHVMGSLFNTVSPLILDLDDVVLTVKDRTSCQVIVR